MRLLTLLFLAFPLLAHAEKAEFSLSDFNKRINEAAQDKTYRDSILKQDGLHTLIPKSHSTDSVDPEPPITQGPAGSDVPGDNKSVKSPTKKYNQGELEPKVQPGKKSIGLSTQPQQVVPTITPPSSKLTKSSKKTSGDAPPESLNGSSKKKGKAGVSRNSASTKKKNVTKDYYFPKVLSSESQPDINAVSVSFDNKQSIFGISIGTSIPVKLRRTSTNVQPGYIELITTADTPGRKKILPEKSILFARPNVVKGSSRLYLNTIRGVTPEGFEFTIKGHVSDHFNTAGLTGVIKSDGRALERSLTKGGLALGGSLINDLADNPVATATGAAANQLIREGSAETSANLDKPVFIVSASPQKGTLSVEETF